MFGMTSEQFWEDDPQLYWSYRIFYLKKIENEQKQQLEFEKYSAWLRGNTNYVAHSLSLGNAFSKSKKEYPTFEKMYGKSEKKKKKMTKQEVNRYVQEEFNAWARY